MTRARIAASVLLLALLAVWAATCSTDEPSAPPTPSSPEASKRPRRAPRAPRPVTEESPPSAPAEAPAQASHTAAPAPPERRMDFDPTIALRLRIIGADGRPAAAHVSIYQDPDAPAVTLDADGNGEATARVRAGLVAVHAWTTEHGVALTLRVTRTEPAGPVDVYLLRGERVSGRVVDERGLAVSTAVLRLALPLDFSGRIVRTRHWGGRQGPECRAVISCRAQDDGTFAFPPLPPESDTILLAGAPGFEPFETAVAALPREQGLLMAEMRSQVVVRGRMTGRRGAPVTDFRLRINGRTLPALVDDAGVFTATGASRQRDWLVVLPGGATGFGPCEVPLPSTRLAELDVGEIRLGAPVRITGTVVWPDGRLVEGGLLEVSSRVFADGKSEAVIGADGSFRIENAGDAQHVLRVSSAERTLDPAPGVAGVTKIRASHAGESWRRGEVVRITLDSAPILVLRSVDAKGGDVPFDGAVQVDTSPRWYGGESTTKAIVDGARAAIALHGRPPWRFWISDASHRPVMVEVAGGWPIVEQTVTLGAKVAR